MHITGLHTTPAFCPLVADFDSGMMVTIPLFREDLTGDIDAIASVYQQKYTGPIVSFCADPAENGFLSSYALHGLDRMEVSVAGNNDRILLTARFDNLGKGASGAAIQCLNLISGEDETAGLVLA